MSARKKTWLWITGIVIFIGAGLIAGWHFLKKDLSNPKSNIVKPLLTDKLKKLINEASDGMYHIEYKKFDLDIDSGKGLIINFKLIPDTAVYHRLLAGHKAPNNIFYVSVDSLIIDHFGFAKTPTGRRFNIAAITIKHPYITLSNKRQPYNDTSKAGKSILMGLVKDLVKITSVQRLTMNNMTLVYVNKNEAATKRTVFRRWNISMTNISVNKVENKHDSTNKAKDKDGQLYARIGFYSISTPDSLYRLKFYNTRLFPSLHSIYASKFILQPRYNKVDFYKKSGFNRDRYYFVYNQMAMRNFDFERLLKRQQIHVGSMSVGSSFTEVFNNYYWPKRFRPARRHVYPHEKLKQLALDITIDTLSMHRSYFQYAIAARQSQRTAKLFMTNIESHIYNITNNTQAIKHKPYTVSITRARMMGAADMRSKYVFDLASKNGAFTNTVWMGRMDARAANPLSVPLGMMAVKSGTINKMYMHINADDYTAKGNIDLYYKNFKINLLKRSNKTDTLKKRGFLSFVTNAVLPNDNPTKSGKFKKGPINVIHDQRMSFFGLLWKCTQDGMSSAMMGIDQHKDKPDENLVIKVIKKVINPFKKKKHLKKDGN